MIKAISLINLLKKNGSNFFTGVPDSVLKELTFLLPKHNKNKHIIAVNEGSAVSIGIGYFLSTKKIPIVYMQNSGLSNALNPLISIAHKKVYSIPLILLIGWRGSPNKKDEPQHNVKGKITERLLKLLSINYTIIRSTSDLVKFEKQIKHAKKNSTIVAGLIENGVLEKNIKKNDNVSKNSVLDKEIFLKTLLENLNKNTKIVSSTGYNSREMLYLREKYKFKNSQDFYMVGGMGHTSSVSLGYSLFSKNKTICLDGDGSFLMHLGSIKSAVNFANKNFKYILLNNNSHDSVGGQPTYIKNVNLNKFSKSIGFKSFYSINNSKNLATKIRKFLKMRSLVFLEVKVSNTRKENLPRPKNLIKTKNIFIK